MKKILLIAAICVTFAGCSKKAEQKVPETAQTQTVATTIIKPAENEDIVVTGNNIQVNSEDSYNNTNYVEQNEIYELNYTLDFSSDGFNTKVYKKPDDSEEIYTLQAGDVVNISNVVYVPSSEKTFIQISMDSGIEGYIKISGNPFKKGNFLPIDTLEVDGANISILKLEASFFVSYGEKIRVLPLENAEALHETTKTESNELGMCPSTAITKDYKWVKIQYGDYCGWVNAECLDVGRGGPVINYPEAYIYFDLIGSNLI